MAKSNHLSWLLLLALICIYSGITGYSVKKSPEPQRLSAKSDFLRNSSNKAIRVNRSELILKVRQIYNSQIGIKESGNNHGPEVERYLHYVNLPKGNPWCAAFVCWVYGQAGVANPRTGWSPALFPAEKLIWVLKAESGKLKAQSGKLKAESIKGERNQTLYSTGRQTTDNRKPITPGTGDVFGLYFPEKGRIAHVGFIDSRDEPWLITVEGNTNPSGAREGDGVYRKRRLIRSIDRVARYIH